MDRHSDGSGWDVKHWNWKNVEVILLKRVMTQLCSQVKKDETGEPTRIKCQGEVIHTGIGQACSDRMHPAQPPNAHLITTVVVAEHSP